MFKKYNLIIGIVLLAVILVLVKVLSNGHFKNDAKKWTGPSVKQTNLITTDRLKELSGELLIINLSEKGDLSEKYNGAINIPASSIVDKTNQKKLRAYKGNIILASNDPAVSARIWMLLSQMGFTNLYILTGNVDNEVLKYNFRPGTLSGPEL